MSDSGKRILKYAAAFAVGIGAAIALCAYRGWADAVSACERYMILTDAFSLPGVLFLGIGGMIWLSGEGALDGVSWLLKNAVKMLIPGPKKVREKYGDYVQRKRSGPKPSGYAFILITGAVLAAIACLFLILYLKTGGAA